MAQTPPFRNRPKFHLELARLTGSPNYAGQLDQTTSSLSTPRNATTYSPFRSAGLRPPAQYEGPVQLTPSRIRKYKTYARRSCFWVRRLVSNKLWWSILILWLLLLWWLKGGSDEVDLIKLKANGFGTEIFQEGRTRKLQFFPAENPKIHVCSPVGVSKIAC